MSDHVIEAARNVAVVITGVEDFGVRTVLLTQFRHAEQGRIRFTYLTVQDGECAKALRAAGASIIIVGGQIPYRTPRHPAWLPFLWLFRLPRLYRAYAGMRRILRGAPYEIVYSHSYYSLAIAKLAARGLNRRFVFHMHMPLNESRLAGLQRMLVSLFLAAAVHKLVAISDFVAASLRGPVRQRVCRIDNGIDVQSIMAATRSIEKDPRRIVIVGRLSAMKKQQIAIRAMRLLQARGTDACLDIIGGRGRAPEHHQRMLEELVDELELADRVRFAGVVSPPFRHIAAAAACVSCATREPFGLVVIEAAACGTAVVAADAGATAELIEHGRTGLLFRPDDPVALADALERLLGNEALRTTLVEAARQRALERYEIGDHVRALRRCFDAALACP